MARFLILAVFACTARAPSPPSPPLRFDVDRNVDPCTDFYAYACGPWQRANPIPADQTQWSTFAQLEQLDFNRERELVEHASRDASSLTARRVGAYYTACLDVHGNETRGLTPIRELLARIDDPDLAGTIAELHRRVAPVLFDLDIEPDPRDVRVTIAMLDAGALGMRSPEDYGDDVLREKYRGHVARVLRLIDDRDPDGDAARVVELERALVHALPSASERRKASEQVHVMSRGELGAIAAAIPPTIDPVDVLYPVYLTALNAALAGDPAAIRAYLRYQIARAFAPLLPHTIDDEVFDFTRRISRGAREPAPRWQRCLDALDRDLGDDVGRLFVAAYFPPVSHARAEALVAQVAAALRRDLPTLDWLGPAARAAAIAKLDHVRFAVGQPARWKNYDDVVVRPDDPVGNVERAHAGAFRTELAKLGKPTDRDQFFEPAQGVDGFGSKAHVSVGFTAGFLQSPVFDPRADNAVNFGGFGGVIGHEITHHFDDVGREYDADGNLGPWWSPDDNARYQTRAACFVDEYAGFGLDSKLTLGENLADNGGLRIAWDAARPRGPSIDGFTPAQRFFLAWAQIRCENITPEAAHAQLASDPHAPGRWRVNGVVQNLPEFAIAFACKSGQPMAPVTRCRLW